MCIRTWGSCVLLFSLRCDSLSEKVEGCGSCMKECVLLRCWKTGAGGKSLVNGDSYIICKPAARF